MGDQTHTVTLTKDGDDTILPLPPETLTSMNLNIGDYVLFTVNQHEGSLTMSKWDGQLDLFEDVTQRISKIVEMEEK